jgi:hypothetical protein
MTGGGTASRLLSVGRCISRREKRGFSPSAAASSVRRRERGPGAEMQIRNLIFGLRVDLLILEGLKCKSNDDDGHTYVRTSRIDVLLEREEDYKQFILLSS